MYKIIIFLSVTLYLISVFVTTTSANGKSIYSSKERKALDQLRNMSKDVLTQEYMKYDSYLIRWLRARGFNVAAANEMIRASAKWRKINNIDMILNQTLLHFNPPVYVIDGVDKEGSPIVTSNAVREDMRRFIVLGQSEKMQRSWYQMLEDCEWSLAKASNQSNGRIFQGVAILDISGFNRRQHTCTACLRMLFDWLINLEQNHPEMAKYIVWINAPRIFPVLLERVKPFLTQATRNAIHIFNSDRKEWSSFLLKLIPADQLTYQFGGIKKISKVSNSN